MLTAATAISTLLTAAVGLQFTPARYWSWRLRRHMQTVEAIDSERQKNQREVLMRRADYLSSRVAAAYRIPTDWGRFCYAAIQFGIFLSFIMLPIVLFIIYGPDELFDEDFDEDNAGGNVVLSFLIVWGIWLFESVPLVRSFVITRRVRAEFIRRGCPPGFRKPKSYWAWRRRRWPIDHDPNQVFARTVKRAIRLRISGKLPAEWPPHSRVAVFRRELCAWRWERDMAKGRATTDIYRLPAMRSRRPGGFNWTRLRQYRARW